MPQTRIQPIRTPDLLLYNLVVLPSQRLKRTVNWENTNYSVRNNSNTADTSNNL